VYGYLFNEGFGRFNNKKYDDAYKHFEASRGINEFLFTKGLAVSLDTNVIFATAIAGSNSGESSSIIPLFEKLISMNYNNVAIYETLAQLYEKQNNKDALSKVVANGLEKFPSSKNLLIYDLNSSIDGGDIQKSIDKLEKASASDPQNSSIILNLGLQYDKANNVDKAKECYEKAISINPNLSEAYFNLGVMFIKGDAELVKKLNAEDDIKKYEALKKQRDETFQKALPNFEKAHSLDPKNADYKQTLKKIYASMNLLDKAAALGE
jgi:tetratricopeptide (TPR) repeat protein